MVYRTQASNDLLSVGGPPAGSMHTTGNNSGPTRFSVTNLGISSMSVSNWVVVVVDFSAWDTKKRPSMWHEGPYPVVGIVHSPVVHVPVS